MEAQYQIVRAKALVGVGRPMTTLSTCGIENYKGKQLSWNRPLVFIFYHTYLSC